MSKTLITGYSIWNKIKSNPFILSTLSSNSQRYLSSVNNNSHIIPINDLPKDFPKEEGIARCKLASLYRIIDRYNLLYGIYNHITIRAPDNESNFFINPLGLNYEEITASSLIKIDYNGNVVDQGSTSYGVNKAGFVLHSAVHKARPDLHCVIHVHTHTGAAISTLKCGLLPISQEALIRGSILSYHDYDGILVDENFRQGIVKSLGPKNRLMMLHNHGLLSCGATVEEAWNHLFDLLYSCETQFRALAAAGSNQENIKIPPENVQKQVYHAVTKMGGVNMNGGIKWGIGDLEYEAEMRYFDLRGYNTGYPYRVKPKFL